jgi:hypothetical protein
VHCKCSGFFFISYVFLDLLRHLKLLLPFLACQLFLSRELSPPWVQLAHVLEQLNDLVAELGSLGVACRVVVVPNQTPFLGGERELPLSVELLDLLLSAVDVTEGRCVHMGYPDLLFVFFLLVEFGEEFAIDAVEVTRLLGLGEAGKGVAFEEAVQLALGLFGVTLAHDIVVGDLVTVGVVLRPLLVVREALVCLLDSLRLEGGS